MSPSALAGRQHIRGDAGHRNRPARPMALRPPGSRTIPLGGKNLSQLHATFFGAPGIAPLHDADQVSELFVRRDGRIGELGPGIQSPADHFRIRDALAAGNARNLAPRFRIEPQCDGSFHVLSILYTIVIHPVLQLNQKREVARRKAASTQEVCHYMGNASLAKRGLSVVRVVDGDFELALGLFGHEVGADEGGEVAVEDPVDVADAEFGAVVLDEAIGLHDVGTDLAAERDVELRFVEPVGFVAALLNFQVVEFRAQHLHGHFAVLVLAALHLAGHDDSAGNVRDANGGFHFIDILAALAAGAESVEFQVIRLDVDFDAVVHFGNDEDGGERSVATRGLIEGGNAYESVHAGFAGEQAVGIFTAELDRGVLDAGFFARSFVEQVSGDAVTLRPA